MSQISKKGKNLSRKHIINNDTKKKATNKNCEGFKEDSCKKYDSFFSLSIKNEKKEDDSLLSVDTPLKYGSTNSGEEIDISNKIESCPPNYSCTDEQLQEGKGQTSELKNIFNDETMIDEKTADFFSFHKESNNLLENSAFVFKSVNYSKNNDKSSTQSSTINQQSSTSHLNDKIDNCDSNIDSNTFSDDDVLISDQGRDENSLAMKNKTVGIKEESNKKILHQCPICFKTVTKHISHMKSCASKNNLTTQQLLSVLKLHEKQLAERKELGLGPPLSSFRARVSPKKSKAVDKKKPLDSNLQLALALSASLQFAEEDEVIQEAEALKEAGLTEEADKKLSTLEKFGFASDFPYGQRAIQGSSKSRSVPSSLLLKRTKEDRERIVTEKVAIVLINEEENTLLDTFVKKRPSLKSKRLLKLWMEDCVLWHKAQCPSEEQRRAFYIQSLSEFVEPSTAEVGEGLRRLSQLPGRLNTPAKCDTAEISTPPWIQSFSGVKKGLYSASTISASPNKTNQLSEDWRTLVGNSYLSDICVHCDQGQVVPAHKLVLYVRCPSVLDITESQGCGRDKLVLENCSKRSALAFLEFVYAGISKKLLLLSPQEFQTVTALANKFNYKELKNELVILSKSRENIQRKKSGVKEVNKKLFVDNLNIMDDFKHKENDSLSNSTTECESSYFESNVKPDSLDCPNYSFGRCSPDMFGDSNLVDSRTNSPERDDLDILASLVGKTTGLQEEDISISAFDEMRDSSNTLSLSGNASLKRKALRSSFSEDENASLCKKVCSDVSPKNISRHRCDETEVLDLTQSSNSSRSEPPIIGQAEFEDENSDDCKIVCSAEIQDDCLENLSQKYHSPSNSFHAEILSPQTRGSVESLHNVGPMYDGYEDDYWYYNNEVNTPRKISVGSPEKNTNSKYSSIFKSVDKINVVSTQSPKISPEIKNISSDSKSPSKSKNCLTPNSFASIQSLSFKDKSLSNISQKTLDLYLSQNSIEKRHSISNSVINAEEHLPELNYETVNAKKNLTSQFNTITDVVDAKNDSSSVSTKDYKVSSPFQSITTSPKYDESILSKTPTTLKKDSLAAIQRLLDDSFEVNESLLASANALSCTPEDKCASKKSCSSISLETNSNQTTPPPEIYVSDKVTPLPDYSSMKTPGLKKELSRFGLKPSLGKSKAKLLLRHIYEQTHPFVPESPSRTKDVFKQPEGQPPRSPLKKSQEGHTVVRLVDSDEESCSQNSVCSSVSSSTTLPEERSFESEEEQLTQADSLEGDVRTSIRNLITNNPELHTKILMYEPIFLEDLISMLRSKGIKCKSDQIIDFLDEQCITFRTTSWKTRNEKRRLKKQNSKKKTYIESGESLGECSKNNYSPSKTQPSQLKKRGHPKKTATK